MSLRTFSDQQTIDKYDSPTLETLLNQNKMKDLALKKATNLIELLNIELEVQKNTYQESIQLIEQQLNKFQTEVIRLRERNQTLEKQLKKINNQFLPKDNKIRHPIMLRLNSTESLSNPTKKRSLNKKYAEPQLTKSPDQQDKNLTHFGAILLKQQLIQVEEWKNIALNDLNNLIQEEYSELGSTINLIESSSEQFQEMLRQKRYYNNKPSLQGQKQYLIKTQQAVINSFKIYTQQLEDLLKTSIFKFNSISKTQIPAFYNELHLEDAIRLIKTKIGLKKQSWQTQLSAFQNQNLQLKSILDNMIKLVKEQKKLRA